MGTDWAQVVQSALPVVGTLAGAWLGAWNTRRVAANAAARDALKEWRQEISGFLLTTREVLELEETLLPGLAKMNSQDINEFVQPDTSQRLAELRRDQRRYYGMAILTAPSALLEPLTAGWVRLQDRAAMGRLTDTRADPRTRENEINMVRGEIELIRMSLNNLEESARRLVDPSHKRGPAIPGRRPTV